MQQGDTDEDFRLQSRILQLPLIVRCDTLNEYYNARGWLLRIFSPSNVAGELAVTCGAMAYSAVYCAKRLEGCTYDYAPSDGYTIRTVGTATRG
jgi:hypothetical protein